MRSWKTPIPEQVSQAVAQLGRVEHRRYFFDKLENPLWLEPLAEKGFFKNPPPAQRDDSDGTISFPTWPESRYLARMAKLSEAHQSVVKIALNIPDTENIQVHSDLADVALALPVELAARFVPKARKWLESPYELLLPEKLGMLVSRLAEGGEVEKSIKLAQALLTVLPDPRSGTAAAAGLEKYALLHPTPRFSVWHYKQVLEKNIPSLVDAGGERTLNLLCDCLEAAIRLSRQPSDAAGPNDYSWIWRPAVEDHEQNRDDGLKDALVDAIRDASERLAKKDPGCVPSLVGLLERRPWQIFPRLALHLLRKFPDQAGALIEERLADRAGFDAPSLRHEYSLLAAACFVRISAAAQEQFLSWIAQGPDVEILKKGHREANGVELPETEIAGCTKWWQRDRLAPLKEVLPQEWKERYKALVKELGEPSHPEFLSYTTGVWVGPTSPKSQEDIQNMAVADVVSYLRTWMPPEGPFADSPEGLGRAVAAAVSADPARFAKEANSFQGLDPTYVRELLWGLRDAARQGRAFDWQPVLDLCAWVMAEPLEIAGRQQRHPENDPDWGWTRKGVADLLSAGLQKGKGEIPNQFRDQCWNVIAALTSDPQPTSEYESQYGGSNMDAASMSINTVRGQAMHAVIHYGLWVIRSLGSPAGGEARLSKGLEEMPEMRGILEKHLDPQHETSLTVRAVYGQWFPWLIVMDPKWAAGKVSSIFPESDEQVDLWRAAWNTYIIFCEPFNNTYQALASIYRLAVERLAPHSHGARSILLPEKRLAEHLMAYYWRGQLPLGDGDELLSRFYEKASAGLRGEALEHVGRSLRASHDEIPAVIMDRLRKLWDARLTLARSASSIEEFGEELSNFGWWFASGKFDEEWALTQLVEVIETWKGAEPAHLVAKRLAEIAGRRPGQAVRALAGLVKADAKGWRLAGFRSEAQSILVCALGSGDQQARQRAVDLIHHLGERGNFEYGELLRGR
jgi:hypothetical protein